MCEVVNLCLYASVLAESGRDDVWMEGREGGPLALFPGNGFCSEGMILLDGLWALFPGK